ncbi:twin-arginine translocase subunit TatC [Halobium salinum]|uniref:Sec-independent protein translocase protein TatC n=1 Tax=Halobium salinum TaxID=1364940 RepID=A0ABD5PAJ6_9EURY|nr:twin-arginine translocase subunit TatC [Halobium salinum]
MSDPSEAASDDGSRFADSPLVAHFEEMVYRLSIVAGVVVVVAVGLFPFAQVPVFLIWDGVMPGAPGSVPPHVYGPLELKLTELKLAGLAGVVVALPVLVYQAYRFMYDGLYPAERRYYLAAVPTSLLLAVAGLAFAYFLVIPFVFSYFLTYSESAGTTAFALRQTFDLVLVLLGYMAFVFQIPLLMMFAIMLGLTTREWLEEKRLYFWGAFLGLSFLLGPDPTGMVPIVVVATMGTLFEGTLALLRWTGH